MNTKNKFSFKNYLSNCKGWVKIDCWFQKYIYFQIVNFMNHIKNNFVSYLVNKKLKKSSAYSTMLPSSSSISCLPSIFVSFLKKKYNPSKKPNIFFWPFISSVCRQHLHMNARTEFCIFCSIFSLFFSVVNRFVVLF